MNDVCICLVLYACGWILCVHHVFSVSMSVCVCMRVCVCVCVCVYPNRPGLHSGPSVANSASTNASMKLPAES